MSHAMEKDYISFEALMRLYGYETWLERDLLEIASLAQHYGLPTRLIDWSYNPYTAAFFASNSSSLKKTGKISLWMMNARVLSDVFDSNFSDVKIYNPHYQWNDNARSQFGLFTHKIISINKDVTALQNELYTEIINNDAIPEDNKYDQLYTEYETFDESVSRLINEYNAKMKISVKRDSLIKITLPYSEVNNLNKNLRNINISECSIYPGYSGIVSDLMNKNSIR
ncbi:FRG domain-containing protein [Pectobacterium brasiliense]|nr:FRG domain-containing protein [Pectobacterium brasiliense]MBN3104349.1 FRG domain-containing protein [Pectobacterium brasiliense]MBN3167433.1 FRG domain-containing protein [Pectobacterium brasiliense]MBN3182714.1 FRG domain-containing protein [Pectobacterium brasiliense]